jgi:hypothetical protein
MYARIQWRDILKLWSSLVHVVSIQSCRLINIKMAVKDCPSVHRKNIFLVPVLNTVVSGWLAVVLFNVFISLQPVHIVCQPFKNELPK